MVGVDSVIQGVYMKYDRVAPSLYFLVKISTIMRTGPIVYRLGHSLLKAGSRVRFPVGSHHMRASASQVCVTLSEQTALLASG
ncbi:MAG: hypothetical protein RIQ72_599 [Candidatus Parcubacteria bacterium]